MSIYVYELGSYVFLVCIDGSGGIELYVVVVYVLGGGLDNI